MNLTASPQSKNQKRAADFMVALGKYNNAVLDSMSTETSKFWQMGYDTPFSGTHNLKEVIRSVQDTYYQLPDGVEFNFLTFTEEGNKVTIEADSYGTLANGEDYNNQHHTAIYFDDDGQVLEYRDYLDTLYIYETLFNGEVKPKTHVAKKDRLLRLSSIPKLLKFLRLQHSKQARKKHRQASQQCHTANEKNKAAALAFIEAIGHQDLITLASIYSVKGSFWQIGKKLVLSGEHSQVETANFIPRIYQRLPKGMSFKNTSIVASDNRVAVESVSNAQLYNGNAYKNQYNFMFYFDKNGRVIKFKEYWGTHHAYEMLFEKETDLK